MPMPPPTPVRTAWKRSWSPRPAARGISARCRSASAPTPRKRWTTRGSRTSPTSCASRPAITIDAQQTNSISIRGISSSRGAGTTGIYIDDTPIQIRALGFSPDDTLPKTFDLDRVEVLRAPPGDAVRRGLRGRHGALHPHPAEPHQDLDVCARRDLVHRGRERELRSGIAGGTPIIDGVLGVRASAWFREDGGYIDRDRPDHCCPWSTRTPIYDETTVLRFAAVWARPARRQRHARHSLSGPGTQRCVDLVAALFRSQRRPLRQRQSHAARRTGSLRAGRP